MFSIPNVLEVHVIAGDAAPAFPEDAPRIGPHIDLLVDVPHGADRTAHYRALEAELVGPLPENLVDFFHLNTDVGAWDLAVDVARRLVTARPTLRCALMRCLVPRTFVDCNRPADYAGALQAGGLTPGIPSYVTNPDDKALLLSRHQAYVDATTAAFEQVCGNGGEAFIPHTYGPRSLGIEKVDADIVKNLHWACDDERHDTWPIRAEVDLLTRDPDGTLLCHDDIETKLHPAFAAAGFSPALNDTYSVHPASVAYTHCTTHKEKVLCVEVRRDLLVDEWTPFAEMTPNAEKVGRAGQVVAAFYAQRLGGN